MSELKIVDLDECDINKEKLIAAIDMKSICSYNVFPFYFDESKVCVASFGKVSKEIIKDLKFLLRKEIFVYKGYKEQIEKYIKIYTSLELGHKAINDMKKEEENQKLYEVKKAKSYSPSVLLVDSIIDLALSKNGSDIHIEPFKDIAVVRIRIDGVLKKVMELPLKAYESVCIRIKIMADMNIVIKKAPQDGRMYYKNCDFRVSSIPTIFGEKIVIRVLYKNNAALSFSDITGVNENEVAGLLEKPNGIVLLTGPTGSGKSTTLYSAISKLNSEEKNIVTIEDPVEMIIEGINQINVNYEAGITFSSGLKNILRQDPDIIMVGEIRDETTAEIAVRAAITGHLVLSTLHTNDAFSAINRLCDMGIQKYLILDALNGVIAQRLLRTICVHCKEEYKPNDYERKVLGLNSSEVLYKGRGCSKCDFSGYHGRKAVFEIISINDDVRDIIAESKGADCIKRYFIQSGVKTLKKSGMELVKRGETTFSEFKRVIYNI
ncbi:type IV pilus assembly protein PilB [Clostridium acetobutylicum]|uniref:General secretion pathway protein E, ATPase n=1 Tax=Clostridium acetobutylicum (strain ATCC 824 / DSM 792 / JCM 1419 / IAM 19013 / LMG 5710 / NBRC 13948 / NRRL B-527 / VKM B-1787 / 2291 / W) TaxID=272562 RepID=Q97HA7_CLOAB|nr:MULTISPECIES: GspE/PulE family protein [Clostridium]AAK80064.1 General secretion pathway protein E, ATPase [Clostridium acetobutylicum ATCC 824]ADZ21156.1 General secretion pathway protein E, ATPase [Clostridium acetobutylicum EA 2018]AEI34603.1 general secretion pathway protein E, ATPase [Clostridium acetobutylicum DSM 1731]AWV79509.1 type II/IV secretion system protein [Clostridium acetobutylicum]MBC2394518.1 type II/IV secretion system protein [Clostridium acetobutylicum]